MSESGFNTVPDDLRTASSAIARAVDGMTGFTLEDSGPDAYGHGGLHTTIADFCATVRRSVHTCGQDANAAGKALGSAAGAYEDADSDAGQTITRAGAL